jgi:hypothetical protein
MAQHAVADVFDELRSIGTEWSLNIARFVPPDDETAGVSIAIGGSDFWSDISLE